MNDKLYSAGRTIVCLIASMLAAEAVSICGQALASDVGKVVDNMKGIVAKPEPVKPGLFGRKKVVKK